MSVPWPLVAVDGSTTLVFALLGAVGVRYRDQPGAGIAAILWFVLGGVALLFAAGRVDIIPSRTAITAVIVGWLAVVPLWAGFVFEHTGRGPPVTRRWGVLAAVYVATAATTRLGAGMADGAFGQLLRLGTSILHIALIGVGLFGVFLLVRSARTYDDLPRGLGTALSISGLGISLFLFSLSTAGPGNPTTLPWTTTALLAVVCAGFSVGVVRYRLFGATPSAGVLARSSVLEAMSEAVIVVDREDRLIDANTAAERSLGVTVAHDAGRPVSAVLGWHPQTVADEPTTVPTPNGRRQFDASRSSLTNNHDEPVGTAFRFKDVTDQRTREQRLEVLNRILRHNLRNDLDAIRAFAEGLSETEVDDPAAVATRIRDTADELVDTGVTVDRAQRIMTQETLDRRSFDTEALVRDVSASVRADSRCRIEVISTGEGRRLTTDRGVLRTALLEVVENAVEHTDEREPTVTIDIDATASGVRIAVRDHGPGIPAQERAVLVDGEETSLHHGSGIGLWFVSWAVTRVGGSLDFDDVDPGSRVVLEIPDQAEKAWHQAR